ncbi:TNT domain-containing protein [Actinomadura spongiicola]|uniref:TNT domain-containing protein n=1 Tax=Actinomadura spongiicola TaxID=2303421 RepID=UPI001F2EBB6A|nr:TNT domain-containing protein [Actinomadura spongiicola]
MTGRNDRVAEAEARVVECARRTAPPGWRRIDLHCRATVAVNDVALSVLTGEGETVTAQTVPEELTGLLMELRRTQYVVDQGTWFSMVAIIEPESARPLYNHDFDPLWDPPIPPEHWRRDQVVMPRDREHVPSWLSDRMRDREPGAAPTELVPLNPAEQMELLSNQVTLVIADHAPPLWRTISGHFQAVGGHVEFPAMTCHRADGAVTPWKAPGAVVALFERLRAGTHAFQGSTWSRIDVEVVYEDGHVRCRANFTYDEEPRWESEPSTDDVRRELERFPRDDVPEWMTRRLGTPPPPPRPPAAPPPPPGGLRRARIFDHAGPDGARPAVSRPPVPPDEVERVTEYLRKCPIVMAARSHAPDRLDPSRGAVVPLTFHTDGTWVWSGAVPYYLSEHGVPPEADLVAHIRAGGFQVPTVDDETMSAANAVVTGREPPERVVPADPRPEWKNALRQRLDQLRVDRTAYRIDDTAEGVWCLVQDGETWSVFQMRNGERHKKATFDDADQAAAQLLGRLLLDPGHIVRENRFEPLRGEPPLTLLRDRHVTELAAGTEVDRYGGSDGNMVYTARTPYPYRSLPREWQDRPYHVYRVRRPVEALAGTAVPWFGQPGGGRAYVFGRSIADLLADGTLVEVAR